MSTLQALNAPVVSIAEVVHNSEELVEIPSELSQLTQLAHSVADAKQMDILIDIFKHSFMTARPIHPFVRLSELHACAELTPPQPKMETTQPLISNSAQINFTMRFRALPTMHGNKVRSQNTECHAVESIEPFLMGKFCVQPYVLRNKYLNICNSLSAMF